MGKIHLKKHLPLLHLLARGKPAIKQAIIHDAGPEVIQVLCECAKNTLNGNIKLSPTQYKKLKRYQKPLRLLANKKSGIRKRKEILQKGGFLGALLGAVIPAIATILGAK